MLRFVLAFFTCVALVPAAGRADYDAFRLHAGSNTAFKGKASTTPDEADAYASRGIEMEPTFGGFMGAERPIARVFTLGGELGLSYWNTEPRADPPKGVKAQGRHGQLDVLARPKLRLVSTGTELYGVAPLGLTAFLPSGDTNVSPGGFVIEDDGGAGFAVGGAGGALFQFTPRIGLTLELGYIYRWFRGGVTASDGLLTSTMRETLSVREAYARLGVCAAF